MPGALISTKPILSPGSSTKRSGIVLTADGSVDGDFLSGSIVRTARADAITFPELGLGAAALAVFLRVISGVPNWLVIGAIDFLGNLDELTVDGNKVLLVLVFH